ncbi:MAG: T9SS type A sorting domain-containing protein [Bacteroidia bacterium]
MTAILLISVLLVKAQTENEPDNNTFLGADYWNLPGSANYHLSKSNDIDIIRVLVLEDGVLVLNVSNIPNINYFYINTIIYQDDGVTVINRNATSSCTVCESSFSLQTLVSPGLYYISMSENSNDSSLLPFTVSLSFDNTDQHEINNTFASAVTVPINSSFTASIYGSNYTLADTVDLEYYKVHIKQSGVLTMNVSNIPNVNYFYINTTIYKNGLATLVNQNATSSCTACVGSFSLQTLVSPGWYYIKMQENSNQTSATPFTVTLALDTSDQCEINNTFAKACTVPINTSFTAKIYGRNYTIPDIVDLEYYKVYVDRPGVLTMNVTNIPNVSYFYLNTTIYKDDQATIVNSNGTSSCTACPNSFSLQTLVSPGWYYIKMQENSGQTSSSLFTVALALDTSDQCELNNTFADACTVPINSSFTAKIYGRNYTTPDNVDLEYYKVYVNQSGVLTMNVTNIPNVSYFYLNTTIYKDDKVTIVNSNGTSSCTACPNSFSLQTLVSPGWYYIKMQENSGQTSSSPFSVALALDTSDECEINNTFADACIVPINTSFTAKIYGRNYTTPGNVDLEYYKVYISQPGTFTLNVSNIPNVTYFYINAAIYKDDGITIVKKNPTSTCTVCVKSFALQTPIDPGWYYIKLQENSNQTSNSLFTVALTLTPASKLYFNNQLPQTPWISKPLGSALITDPNPNPVKICADGSKSTYIEYYNSNINVQQNDISFRILEDPLSTNTAKYGSFDMPVNESTSPQIRKVFYNHPIYMDSGAVYRQETVQVYNVSNGNILYNYPIRIYRAPLLCVHGLWGNRDAFKTLEKKLIDNSLFPGIGTSPLIYRMGYPNAASFESNKSVVMFAIDQLLDEVVNNNYSAGKVDIVAHSMGGIVSRLYIQNPYGSVPFRNDVHKLITLNTPHSGSQFGDWATSTLGRWVLVQLNWIIEGTTDVDDDVPAINDLSVNSAAIDNVLNGYSSVNNASVPTFAITSSYDTYLASTDPQCWASKLVADNNSSVFNNHLNDGVVEINSQQGNIFPFVPALLDICHMDARENQGELDTTIRRLNLPPTSAFFDINGYNPPDLTYIPPPSNGSNIALSLGTVNFNAPIYGTSFNSGATINISATGSSEINRMSLVVGNEISHPLTFDTVGNVITYNYQIPNDALGELRMIVFGYDSLDHYTFDTLRVYVNTTDTLTSIGVYPSQITVPQYQKTTFEVSGYYSNGVVRNLSGISAIQYSVNDTNIAVHTYLNEVAGKATGEANLTISYLGKHDSVLVKVINGDDFLHAGFMADNTSLCGTGNSVSFTNYSSGDPVSYEWQFPGGNPSTSTLVNPIITYNSTGNFSVTLIATYSSKMDTLKIPQYIKVSANVPAKPGVITVSGGSTNVCPGESRTYTTPLTTGGTYKWIVPTGARITNMLGTNIINVTYDSGFVANGTLSVVKVNGCGSSLPRTLTIGINNPTAAITTSGLTTFCTGANSLTLTANPGIGYSYQWKKGNSIIAGATGQSYIPTASNNSYKVVVTNSAGCSKTSTGIAVTVNPLPNAIITPQGSTTFCTGGSVVLHANGGTGLTYQWKKGFNNIGGAILQNYTASIAGTYKVIVTKANGCSKVSSGTVITINCRLSEKDNEETKMEVFPNPTDGIVTIKFTSPENQNCDLIIIDATGKELMHEQVTLQEGINTIESDLSDFAKGIYLLKFSTRTENFEKKIVVQ